MTAAREDADVETSTEGYARRFEGPVGRYFLDVQARATLALLRPWPRGTVLDVGGGHAQVVGPLVDEGYDVTVYGSAPVCEERLKPWTTSGRARFVHGDLLGSSFTDRGFDVVLSYRLLAHVARWRELVAELSRIARHAVLLDYPTVRSVNAASDLFFAAKKSVEGNTRPFTVFRDADVARAFLEVGFRRAARRPQFFFPMALHRAHRSSGLARGLEAVASVVGLTSAFGSPVIARFDRAA